MIENQRTKGSLGTSWAFQNDGTVVSNSGALVDMPYTITGNVFKSGSEAPPQEFQIINKQLIFSYKGKESQRLNYVGGKTPTSVIGRWTYKHYTGGTATEIFTKSGMRFLSVPLMPTSKGHFKTPAPGELFIDFTSPDPAKITFNYECAEAQNKCELWSILKLPQDFSCLARPRGVRHRSVLLAREDAEQRGIQPNTKKTRQLPGRDSNSRPTG